MAVYEGARPRSTLSVRRRLRPAPSAPRRRRADAPAALRGAGCRAASAGRRPNRVGLVLGGIVVAFLLAFFSLAQTIRVSATGLRHRPAGRRAPAPRAQRRATSAPTSTGSAASRRSASRRIDAGLGQLPSRSSCRPARPSTRPMLGRTDSRGRLLVLLVVLTVVAGSLAASAWPTGRSPERDRLAAMAREPDHPHARDRPRARGTIYDRTGTIVLATTVDRYRLVAAPDQLTPGARGARATELVDNLDLDDEAAATLRERPRERPATTSSCATRPRARTSPTASAGRWPTRRVAQVSLEPEPDARLPAGRRRPGHDARRPPARLRQPRGRGPVRRRAGYYQRLLAGEPKAVVAQRDANGQPILDDGRRSSTPGVPGADLRLTIDAGLQLRVEQELLATWVADTAQAASRPS